MGKITINGIALSEYRFVTGDGACEKFAASELKSYFKKITGKEFSDNGKKIIRLNVDKNSGLCRDGFRITNTQDELSVVGGGESGVIYGAYEILERYLGVRFFTPDLEKLGNGGDIPLGEYSFEPVFRDLRESDWPCGRNVSWSVKNRINDLNTIPQEMGGHFKCANGLCHTMEEILGTPQSEQPCLSDPKNLKKAIAYVHDTLKKNPNVDIVEISQNDNRRYCSCEKCAAVDKEEGSHMGTMIRFVNAIADSIKDEYPNVAIRTFAYQHTRQPAQTAPRDNVIVRLCSIECCFSHHLSDPTCELNRAFIKDIIDWGKICKRITAWDYLTNFNHYIAPFPNFDTMRHNMRFFADNGVSGMYPQGNYQSTSGEFGELRAYLLAKLMWNPYMTDIEYQSYMNEFLEAYYGDGWRYIRAFIDFMTGEAKQKHMRCFTDPLNIISSDMVKAMKPIIEGWWNTAEAMAGEKIENVKRSRLQWKYMMLFGDYNSDDARAFYEETKKMGVRWSEGRMIPENPMFDTHISQWYNK